LQGRSFVIGPSGGTVGRRPESTIGIFASNVQPNGEVKYKNIDPAVSMDNGRIEMDPETGEFYVMDGRADKPSTNGVWYRLSGPNQESPYHVLTPSTEVYIAGLLFQVSESMTITEREIIVDSK
jgi:hypothetical protein